MAKPPSPTPAKRGPYARSHKRRQQIADAVLRIVDEQGHEHVTTALVARESEVAEPTVLYHFPTKDHLLVAAMTRADDLAAAGAGAEMDAARLDIEDLRRIATPSPGDERRMRLHVMLKGQSATPGHPAADYIRHRSERSVRIFTRLVARRQEEGLAHPGLDPEQTARQITALWDGLGLMQLTTPGVDTAGLLADAVRRLTGQNFMQARALLDDPGVGL
jgi:AcrR family transcriptional regulator